MSFHTEFGVIFDVHNTPKRLAGNGRAISSIRPSEFRVYNLLHKTTQSSLDLLRPILCPILAPTMKKAALLSTFAPLLLATIGHARGKASLAPLFWTDIYNLPY